MQNDKKLRVLLLAHPDLVPPKDAVGTPMPDAPWRVEKEVTDTLRGLGHEVQILGVYDELQTIETANAEWRPHIAFNLLEDFDGVSIWDQNIVSYLEMIRLRYTGCNPRGLMLARDKALAKKVLAFHDIQSPDFFVVTKGHVVRKPKELEFPLIVKSVTEEASLGITQSSIVHSDSSLDERVRFIHHSLNADALVESYINGRELYVGMMGNQKPETLPVWELSFKKAPANFNRIATRRVKWNPKYRKKYGIESHRAKDLSEQQTKSVQEICRTAYRVLGLNGYARMDLRLSESGKIFLIEANPNPHIGRFEDFADSAKEAGLSYPELIEKILRLGIRWQRAA